ncbi:Apolipoprotein L3 [Lemmus lemmus]
MAGGGSCGPEALKELVAHVAVDDNDSLQKEQNRKMFLESFFQLKKEFEVTRWKLRAQADHIEQIPSGCAFSSMVASSTGAASEILYMVAINLTVFILGALRSGAEAERSSYCHCYYYYLWKKKASCQMKLKIEAQLQLSGQ